MAGYVIYLRKSRADLEMESRGEGETLARHRAALLEVAKRYVDWRIGHGNRASCQRGYH